MATIPALPLFPLPLCLMPNGITELRIFEPRYQRLVAEASTNQHGFGLCLYDSDKQMLLGSGCLVEIIDFSTRAEDGLLAIVVRGKQRFTLQQFTIEHDGLKRGVVDTHEDWPSEMVVPQAHGQFIDKLHELYQKNQWLDTVSSTNNYRDISWVCQRWLEILPIETSVKHQLILQPNHQMTLKLLHQLLE